MGSSDSYEKFQQPILDILNKLYDDRVTKKDLEKVEDKIEKVEDKIEGKVAELKGLIDEKIEKVERKIEKVEDKIEKVEHKIDVRTAEVTSQIKELNDKTFCEQDSLGSRVNNLEKDSKLFKWAGSSIIGVIITFIVLTFKKLFS